MGVGSLLSRPHAGASPRGLKAMGDEILGVSYTSWPPEGDLGAHWLLGVSEEPPLAREPWKAET